MKPGPMKGLVYAVVPSIILWTLIVWGMTAISSPVASAALLCEHRSAAHIAEHGGKAEDDRWHISRAELPNCDDKPGSDHDEKASPDQSSDNQSDDRKSRYCRTHVIC